jgi:hypothetical protein
MAAPFATSAWPGLFAGRPFHLITAHLEQACLAQRARSSMLAVPVMAVRPFSIRSFPAGYTMNAGFSSHPPLCPMFMATLR